QEDVLDEPLEDLVRGVEIEADDDAGDQDDDRALDHLRLRRPLDLLELTPRFGCEPAAARAGDTARAGLALDGLRGPDLGLALASARLEACRRFFLRETAGSPLSSGLAGHQRVSRCSVCRPHQRQYFLNSTRSGEFRFDFSVW